MINKHIKELNSLGVFKYFYKYFLMNHSTKQIVVKNTFWLFMTEGIEKAGLFILNIILARYLGVAGFGRLSFVITFATLFTIFNDFGTKELVIREISKIKNTAQEKISSYLTNFFTFKVLLCLITLIIIFVSTLIIDKPIQDKQLIRIYSFYLSFFVLNLFFQGIYLGFEKIEFYFILSIIKITSYFIFILLLIYFKQSIMLIITAFAVILGIITVLNFLLIFKSFIKIFSKISFKKIFNLFNESWPLAISMGFTALYTKMDIVLLSFIKDDINVGIYSAAYKIYFAAVICNHIIHDSLLSHFSKFFHNNNLVKYRKLLKKVLFYSSCIYIPVLIIFTIFNKNIVWLFFGEEYIKSASVLVILSWTSFVFFISRFWGNSLIIMNRQKFRSIAYGVGAVVNIVLHIILINIYGYIGAGLSLFLTEILIMFLQYIFSSKEIKLKMLLKREEVIT